MKLCIIGTGYIGLVGATVFSDWGNEVIGVDVDKKKIERIQAGDMPIYEPGLSELVLKNVENKHLRFTTDLEDGVRNSEIIFICVGTPQDHDGSANLSYVYAAAKEIATHINDYKVIVVKSTVPVGTNEQVKRIISENIKKGIEFDVVSNPEFLREGSSVEDMMNTDRTVLGSDSKRALEKMKALYQHLNSPIVECDLRSAELIKYASNSFLATKITFINEISQLCEKTGADVSMVAKGMGLDKRIGPRFLNAGLGYGGSCFPKDVSALYKTSMDYGYHFKILDSVISANEAQKNAYIYKIVHMYGENLTGKTFACLGLSFKDNTDDVRESVAIKVIRALRGMGAKINAYDPKALETGKKELGDSSIEYFTSPYKAVMGVDAICILTEWQEFGSLDLDMVRKSVRWPVIFDGRNKVDSFEALKNGFAYYGIGRKSTSDTTPGVQ